LALKLNYGAFITAIINFLIIALVLFFMLKAMNKLMNLRKKKEEEAPAAPPEPSDEVKLLTEIKDILASK
jgi:large conductance mechanosensitive channel